MDTIAALTTAAVLLVSLFIIVKGWRVGGHTDDPDFVGASRRQRVVGMGQAFGDAVIVLTIFSFDLPLFVVGEQATFLGRVAVGLGFLVAIAFLPSLTRPLVALLAGLSVMLAAGGAGTLLLAAIYIVAAVVLAVVRR